MQELRVDSIKKRYIYKLFANFVALLTSSISQAIIPRILGPVAYGDFNFLNGFFTESINFLDAGSSTAFYTKLSHRKKEFGLVTFYLYFCGAISLFLVGFVSLTKISSLYRTVWPSQRLFFIYLAAFTAILIWFTQQVLSNMADAYGITVSMEKAKALHKIVGLIFIIFLFIFCQLNLATFFYYNIAIAFLLIAFYIWTMGKNGYAFKQYRKISLLQIKKYLKEFYRYVHPLFIYSIVCLIVGIFDKWLLQIYSGSAQQGFFWLSYQIGALCFLFTNAMTPLLIREFSIAFGNNDLTRISNLFRRYLPFFYSFTACFSCFVAIQAEKIIYLFGGSAYKEATSAVVIMSFFPIHQTYGQLSNSVFYATGQTRLYRNIGIIFMLIGLPITYLLIAPFSKMGLNAGATGLAIKMVLLQIIATNVALYFNAKFLKLQFWKYLAHQIISVACLLLCAVVAAQYVNMIPLVNKGIITNFIFTGLIYVILIMFILYKIPLVFGIRKDDIFKFRDTFLFYLKRPANAG